MTENDHITSALLTEVIIIIIIIIAIIICYRPSDRVTERLISPIFKTQVACKGYTSVLSKMVSVIFAVLEVSF